MENHAHPVDKSFGWTGKFDSIQKLIPCRHGWSKKNTYDFKKSVSMKK